MKRHIQGTIMPGTGINPTRFLAKPGITGTPERDLFEYELQLYLIGKAIRQLRRERNLTQEEPGKLIGVQKAQISHLENNAGNVTLDTLLRVFTALKAKAKLQVELSDLNFSVGG